MNKVNTAEIKSFKDLNVWQEAKELSILLHKHLPTNIEALEISNFLKKYSILVVVNIAQGYYKKSVEEKIVFFYEVQNFLNSIESALIVAFELNYLNVEANRTINGHLNSIRKLLFALINKMKNWK